MKKITVFGKPGSGKSTLSKSLSVATGIQLHQLDSIVYEKSGTLIDRNSFDLTHQNILAANSWIIEGFGPIDSFNERLVAADTLIYIDLPYFVSYWLVTKRLLKSWLVKPEGWPDGSSVFKGTMQSYKMLMLSPKFWHGEFLKKLNKISSNKSLYVINSIAELNSFIDKNMK